jgi:alkanesulfonate monooxygenase SsuD/methylene tetrahydromethanopterin reductase-like flavin-dependent oxidoreductase (luciferase family)
VKFGLFGGATARSTARDAIQSSAERWREAPSRAPAARSDDSQDYDTFVDAIVEAEGLGYHSIFLVEHHFTGVGQVSASLNLLTFLAARTRRMRLGTAVIVMPWHNPVLLAEQAATIDVLSNGRLDLGVGRGYRPNEFRHFCVPLEEAGERFEESMALLKQALSSDQRFSHHSKRWHFEDIVVEPPPVQKPHPPLWLAAGRPESIREAAADGYSLLLDQFATFDVTLSRFRVYRDAIEQAGARFDPMSVAVARGIAIVRDEDERQQAITHRIEALDRMNRLGRTADGSYVSSMNSDPNLRKAAVEGTLIGTPGEIIDQIRQLRNGGVEYILLAGAQSSPKLLRDFAAEVMPAFA